MQKNSEPFLSVIVPMFNTEKYILHCIESILNQSWSDFEIIVVDDGSNDQSVQICENISKVDDRVRIIHVKHKGLVCARKIGIEKAKGKYIGFVDSDDWISKDMYFKMCNVALQDDADIVICDIIRYENENKMIEQTQHFSAGLYLEEDLKNIVFPNMLFMGKYYEFGFLPCVWNKIYKRDIIKECILHLVEEITIGEDVCLTLFSMWKTRKLVYLKNEFLYYYRNTSNSLMKQKYSDQVDKIVNLLNFLDEEIKNVDFNNVLRTQFEYYISLMVSNVVFELYGRNRLAIVDRQIKLEKLKKCRCALTVAEKCNQLALPNLVRNALQVINKSTLASKIKLTFNMFMELIKVRRKKK